MAKYELRIVGGLAPDDPNYLKLGITPERVNYIDTTVQAIASDPSNTSNMVVMAKAVEIAETLEEMAYICYTLGVAIARAYQVDDAMQALRKMQNTDPTKVN